MKLSRLFFITAIIMMLFSCKQKLPQTYGIFIVNKGELNEIESQDLKFKGNLMYSIVGLSDAKVNFASIEEIFVYKKDVKPDDIKLTKLKYSEGEYINNLFGQTYTEVKLWVSDRDVEIKISPVENKADMYKVMFVNPLEKGFYAINFGELSNKNTLNSIDKKAYGFVIGDSLNYYHTNSVVPHSKNDVVVVADTVPLDENESGQDFNESIDENNFYNSSSILLKNVNNYFNSRNYDLIHQIYRNEDGSKISDADWGKLVEGFKNWYVKAGKIKSSKFKWKEYSGTKGTFTLETNYEKSGRLSEEMDVIMIDQKYYITFIGTR